MNLFWRILLAVLCDFWFHYGWTPVLVREICIWFEVKVVGGVKREKFQRAYLLLLCLDVNCLNLYLKVLLKINFVELSEYASYLHIKINTQFDLKKKRKVLASRRTYPSKGFFGKSSNKGPATEESASAPSWAEAHGGWAPGSLEREHQCLCLWPFLKPGRSQCLGFWST